MAIRDAGWCSFRDFSAPVLRLLAWIAVAASLGLALGGCERAATHDAGAAGPVKKRTIVIGFDGLDPALTEQWIRDGALPNFARLAKQGHYQRLGTTTPPQSPVAWASFATGTDPGQHRIFDFLARDPKTYLPDFSIATVIPPARNLDLFGYRIPLSDATIENRRQGKPFWMALEEKGMKTSILRVPVTFPPDNVHRMLSGMGVPDLLGTQGTYSLVTTDTSLPERSQGRVLPVRLVDGVARTRLEGPGHPLKPDAGALWLPLAMQPVAAGSKDVAITLGEDKFTLTPGQWSTFHSASFPFFMGHEVKGIVRMYLISGFPDLRLYISPLNIDPREPAMPISSPPDYAATLSKDLKGVFHTLGMAEETWSLNEGHMTDEGYLDMVKTVLAEREAMFFDTMKKRDSELVTMVFVQPDRVSHMFWRGIDPQHPLHAQSSPLARGAVKWIYQEADRILGRTLDQMQPEDKLIVLSDHGFAPFRRAVHLNRWLADHKLLALQPGKRASSSIHSDVDWSRTKAYAVGLNGIYLNLAGREAKGVVAAADAAAVKKQIRDDMLGLVDTGSGQKVISEVYDGAQIYHGPHQVSGPDLVVGYASGYRASWQTALGDVPSNLLEDNLSKWSGDHCIASDLVPGVLFTSFPLPQPVTNIQNIGQLVGASLGLKDIFGGAPH